MFELVSTISGVAAVVNLGLWLLTSRFGVGSARWLGLVSRVCSILSLAIFVACAIGILERQSPRWADIRGGIRQRGDAIAAAARDKDGVLSAEEFSRLRQTFMPNAVPVQLPGYGTVWLRMAHGRYPYVGVAFSSGDNAVFDPRTMICTYSD